MLLLSVACSGKKTAPEPAEPERLESTPVPPPPEPDPPPDLILLPGHAMLTPLTGAERRDPLALTGDAQTWHVRIEHAYGIGGAELAPISADGGRWPEAVELHFVQFRGMEGLNAVAKAADGSTSPLTIEETSTARNAEGVAIALNYRVDTSPLGSGTPSLIVSWVDFYR